MSIRQWLSWPTDRRRSPRFRPVDLVAYYWTGAYPAPNPVREIGLYGARIAAPEVFYIGTVVEIVFEDRAAGQETGQKFPHACAYGRVLRQMADGFCVEFVFDDTAGRRNFRRFVDEVIRRDGNETNIGEDPIMRGTGSD